MSRNRNRNRVTCWIVTPGSSCGELKLRKRDQATGSLPLACPELSADFIRLPPGKTVLTMELRASVGLSDGSEQTGESWMGL